MSSAPMLLTDYKRKISRQLTPIPAMCSKADSGRKELRKVFATKTVMFPFLIL